MVKRKIETLEMKSFKDTKDIENVRDNGFKRGREKLESQDFNEKKM